MKIIISCRPKNYHQRTLANEAKTHWLSFQRLVELFCGRPLEDLCLGIKQANLNIFKIYFYLGKADWAWTEHSASSSYGPTHSHPLRTTSLLLLSCKRVMSHISEVDCSICAGLGFKPCHYLPEIKDENNNWDLKQHIFRSPTSQSGLTEKLKYRLIFIFLMWGSERRRQYQEHRYDGDLTGGVLDEPAAKNDSFPNMSTLYPDITEYFSKHRG